MHLLALVAAAISLSSGLAAAAQIDVVGLFPGKAVLVIDNGPPKTYSVGSTIVDGIRLVGVNSSTATIDSSGKRQTIAIGEHVNRTTPSGPASVTLHANSQGHFVTQGQINGGTMRMLVDTGATMIALSAADATRLSINYKKGMPGYVNTANGTAPVYRVTLNTVKVGDIELHQVDAVVHENGLPFALLGMSFLNRTEMRREGTQMILTKRY
ncbi:MAG TPA: TIGR02281 family clan AA aspartic protease [Burkholderiaceae bacterium]|nr:TIGR02281 family clan AA aspartic protease [Burkholderiaceae bacterium]